MDVVLERGSVLYAKRRDPIQKCIYKLYVYILVRNKN